jgi:hypothetical protein
MLKDSLAQKYSEFKGDPSSKIPWIIWLLENPDSPLALGGSIDLRRHDYLHILFNKGFSNDDEAFVIGVTMGNDTATNWFHYLVFKIASLLLYPPPYRFTLQDLKTFDNAIAIGKKLPIKNLNQLDFSYVDGVTVEALRKLLKIDQAQ